VQKARKPRNQAVARPMSEPSFNAAQAHCWFGEDFHSRAWRLVEKNGRNDDETKEMIHAAHAACLHWQAAGAPLDIQRAENLLAIVYLQTGHPELALDHARRGLALSEQNSATQTTFDRATALAAAAKAYNLAGNGNEAYRLIMLSLAEAETLSDDERARFDKLYGEAGERGT
jgi:hypothetical protein